MNQNANNSTETSQSSDESSAKWTWPLTFQRHKFTAHCYDNFGCSVKYAGVLYGSEDANKPSLPKEKYEQNMKDGYYMGGHLGIKNFPPPAIINWTAKDGTKLHAEIDMAEIFKDQKILHNLKKNDVDPNTSIDDPSIIVIVVDRKVRVYMKTSIPLKELKDPSNQYSWFNNDMNLAFEKTY